ncbi:MAG: GC-type dockerin domain-anchored protein [Planctomycetota bacterium]|nr:GC-type dockerin domain-anchored protein [Planctomycetota bacterium]
MNPRRNRTTFLGFVFALLTAVPAANAQWDPDNGQWGKSDPDHLRVMTWNVQDSICSSATDKREQFGDWHALVCIVASMQPDILILQETGDNSGNGTGSGVDSVTTLTAVVDLFLHGGNDPFEGGNVTSYVQKYAPGFDMPYVFVSSSNDGFNRNIILSRYPFTDLNGDNKSTLSDIPFVAPDQWAQGGNGGIRGYQFAEIDLPDNIYPGDLVVGNAHLKAGGGSSDHNDRVRSARNVGYYIYYMLGGAGTGTPDPNDKIADNPNATNILDANTPVIWGGDWNEDEQRNGGTVGPADWFARGGSLGGNDGTDRDGSDARYDDAREYFSGSRTTQSSSKLDYIAAWDSIATPAREFIFLSSAIPSGKFPPELLNFPTPQNPNPLLASNTASDHRPVIVDFILPTDNESPPGSFDLVSPADGATDTDRESLYTWDAASGADTYTITIATDAGMTDIVLQVPDLTDPNYQINGPVLEPCTIYFWGVNAFNANGQTQSDTFPAILQTTGVADFNGDGNINTLDVLEFLNAWAAGESAADVNLDGAVNTLDVLFFLNAFNSGC